MSSYRKYALLITAVITAISVLFSLAACKAEGEPSDPSVEAVEASNEAPADPSLQAAYWRSWESSAHANTFALEKGPNTYCSKCHSPLNWDRSATIDDPPQCVSCKFPFEEEPRVAAGNPLVPEEEWKDIGCENCHRMEDGIASPEPAWLDMQTNFYETVDSSSELCEECHLDNETLRHARHLGDGPHGEFACTECHDAHTLAASCNNGPCHSEVKIPHPDILPEHRDQGDATECTTCHRNVADIHMGILNDTPTECIGCHGYLMGGVVSKALELGHGQTHETVNCVACHDATGLEAGPQEGSDIWVVYRTVQLLGRSSTNVYQSHNIQRLVACYRCHYPDNPWGLNTDVQELLD
jgi:hypothetical protein